MKPFNLEEAKAGKPVCISDGKAVRIICFDKSGGDYPIVALYKDIEGKECVKSYTAQGWCIAERGGSPGDLVMATKSTTVWVNLYRGVGGLFTGEATYQTQREAINARSFIWGYVGTFPLHCEV